MHANLMAAHPLAGRQVRSGFQTDACVVDLISFNSFPHDLTLKRPALEYSHSALERKQRRQLSASPLLMNSLPGSLVNIFVLSPRSADRVIPLTFLINHWGVEGGSDMRNWISGPATVGNSSHQHPECNPIQSFYRTHQKQAHVCTGR